MSHFSVLVVTDHRPSKDGLTEILQPWHEFECTGIDDQYVRDIDRTEEALAEYSKATTTYLKAPDGSLHCRFTPEGEWKPEFSVPGEYGQRKGFCPPGYEEVEILVSTVETAAQWINGYYGWGVAGVDDAERLQYGYIELGSDGEVKRCIDRTNPNKKWDWWTVGGRWSGLLRRISDGREVDQAMKGHVDIVGMRKTGADEGRALWAKVQDIVRNLPTFEDFATLREKHPGKIDEARTEYWEQPAIKALRDAFPDHWGIDDQIAAARMDEDAFAKMKADAALSTFAFVKDGEWVERGKMGWFACVSDEQEQEPWGSTFNSMIDELPDTA